MPSSTSKSEFSTKRAIYGATYTVSGTIAAVVPIDVPATNLVKGTIAINKMMNGIDLKILIIGLRIW